jgi:magnesium chelatase subunit D
MPAPTDDSAASWTLPEWGAAVLAVDPVRSGGMLVVAPSGPETEGWRALARWLVAPRPWRSVAPSLDAEQLTDSVDLARTLATGRMHRTPGIVAEVAGGVLEVRWPSLLDVHTAHALSRARTRVGLVATQPVSTASEDDARVTPLLADVLALHVLVPGRWAPQGDRELLAEAVAAARDTQSSAEATRAMTEGLVVASDRLGVRDPRTVAVALRTARVLAALRGAGRIEEEDLSRALALVIIPRAAAAPAVEERARPTSPEDRGRDDTPASESPAESDGPGADSDGAMDAERMVAAAASWIEPEALARARAAGVASRTGSGGGRSAGARAQGGVSGRGRTVRSRVGRPGRGRTLHVLETLRAAAPLQAVRGAAGTGRVDVRAEDLRIRVRERRDPSTVVFAVDASGSQAVARLGEVKGAVELMLADSYRRRDHVALVAFRGDGAELILPPTRSLTRARRATTGMPGGGGTPLAHGIATAAQVARSEARLGRRPLVVILTDGRPNVPMGSERRGREHAREDALQVARAVGAEGWPTMIVDSARRPQAFTEELAKALGATLVRLTARNPEALRDAITRSRDGASP